MSLVTRRARAVRLERWAGIAMRQFLERNRIATRDDIARISWEMAVAMEDARTRVIAALRGVDVEEP